MSDELSCKLPLPDKDTFKAANTEAKLLILYDLQCVGLENQAEVVKYLQRRKKIDTGIASVMGAITGFFGGLFGKAI